MTAPREVDAVNAYRDDTTNPETVLVALRIDGEWTTARLTQADADTLGGMLYLLTRGAVPVAVRSWVGAT